MKSVQIVLTHKNINTLRGRSKDTGLSVSELVRRAIDKVYPMGKEKAYDKNEAETEITPMIVGIDKEKIIERLKSIPGNMAIIVRDSPPFKEMVIGPILEAIIDKNGVVLMFEEKKHNFDIRKKESFFFFAKKDILLHLVYMGVNFKRDGLVYFILNHKKGDI